MLCCAAEEGCYDTSAKGGIWEEREVRELIYNRIINLLAEREGFEPPIPLRVCLISSQVHSTGLCHLSAFVYDNSRAKR